jgi:C1A family cysteine protease
MTGSPPRTPAIDVQPIVSYPRTAARGKRYLLTIDLRSSTTPDAWPSDSEELAVYCAARAEPPGMFRIQPLGRPSVVVHRFGGSYGPASFVLTAADREMHGQIILTLSNGWGIPFTELPLPDVQVLAQIADQPDLVDVVEHRFNESSAVSSAPQADLPPAIDLRPLGPPAYNQGQMGSSVAQPLAAAIQFDQMRRNEPPFLPSRLFIYYNARRFAGDTSGDTGARLADAVRSVVELGVCPEDLWSYELDLLTAEPPEQCYAVAAEHRFPGVVQIVSSLENVKRCLTDSIPVVFGLTVHNSFLNSDVSETGRVPLPGPDDPLIGGHAMLLVGYDDSQREFVVRNSWGRDWGVDGHCFIPYEYVLGADGSQTEFWALNPPSSVTVFTPTENADAETPPDADTPADKDIATDADTPADADSEQRPRPRRAPRLRKTSRFAVYDLAGSTSTRLSANQLVWQDNDPPSVDPAVNESADGMRAFHELLRNAFDRDSFDGRGAQMRTGIHYGRGYVNAFWSENTMIAGDGDGRLFNRFTVSPEMFGHAFGHGVILTTRPLASTGQAGAMGESLSDIFGVLTRQWTLQQRAVDADWLIGVGLLASSIRGVALRSMRAPGTAYDDPALGRDAQPAHMDAYDPAADIHISCGIPNRAFYLAATALGGYAWERAGRIWYLALRDKFPESVTFRQAARATIDVAAEQYGRTSPERNAVEDAWTQVGVMTPRTARKSGTSSSA